VCVRRCNIIRVTEVSTTLSDCLIMAELLLCFLEISMQQFLWGLVGRDTRTEAKGRGSEGRGKPDRCNYVKLFSFMEPGHMGPSCHIHSTALWRGVNQARPCSGCDVNKQGVVFSRCFPDIAVVLPHVASMAHRTGGGLTVSLMALILTNTHIKNGPIC
jgi:hypothetical protein